MIDIEAKLRAGKGKGYMIWAERNNIDAKAQSIIYLKENQIPDFTQQMIYESHIYYYSTEAQKDGSKLVTYRLEYKIYQNNGTYRRDVGSDSPKPEYLVLWVSPDESDIKIERIVRS